MKIIMRGVSKTQRLAGVSVLLAVVSLTPACRSSPGTEVEAADIVAKTTQALQPGNKITHLTAEDKDRGINVEVWLDPANGRARADNVTNGHRTSEIITGGRTYDEIPGLSSGNTPDESLSLALPWFIATQEALAPAVQSSTVTRGRTEGRNVLTVNEMTDDGISPPYLIWPTDSPFCPLQRALTVDASSYLPIALDVTLLCQQEGYGSDYRYQITYSNVEFLEQGSLSETQFSPEAVRAGIIAEELTALKSSPFDVYWLGSELPDNLKITADDGLKDARTNWPSEEGEAAFFAYSQLHSTGNGLEIYEWPAGESGLHCSTEWPVSRTQDVTTKFGPALYCDAGQHQLVLTAAGTMLRLEYSLGDPQWFVDRANALIPLE